MHAQFAVFLRLKEEPPLSLGFPLDDLNEFKAFLVVTVVISAFLFCPLLDPDCWTQKRPCPGVGPWVSLGRCEVFIMYARYLGLIDR